MQQVTIPEMKLLLKHVAVDLREPVMVWGSPGIGKTEGVAQFSEENGYFLCDVRLGQYDSVDLRGFPGIHKTTGLTVWHAPSTLPFVGNKAFPTDKLIILMLDEINAASAPVAGVAYQLINERRVGEHKLLDNVIVVAAGNREGDRGVTNKMPLPLANRLTHAEAICTVDAWCEYQQAKGKVPPVALAFYQFRKNLLSTFDPSKPDKAFATPRTSEKMWLYYNTDMPLKIKQAAMAGACGDGVALEAWAFTELWESMIPIARIVNDPTGVELPKEAGMMYAVSIAVSGSMNKKTITPLHTFLCRMSPEFAIMAWSLAVKRDPNLFSTNEYLDFAKRFKVVFS